MEVQNGQPVATVTLGYNNQDTKTYEWYWDGVGTAPNATFTQSATFSVGAMSVSVGAGVTGLANRKTKLVLCKPDGTEYSGGLEDTTTPINVDGPAAPTPTAGSTEDVDVSATLTPYNYYYNYRIKVTVKSQAQAGASVTGTNGANLTTTSTGSANSGLQKITPTGFGLQP